MAAAPAPVRAAGALRVIGIDPGLRFMGWGIVDTVGARLVHVANGRVASDSDLSMGERLVQLHEGLAAVLAQYQPEAAAVEETFVNKNPTSTLKLGLARGIAMLVPAQAGLPVAEYAANAIKKSVVGVGHAAKEQVQMMVQRLLPGVVLVGPDAADALAVAICHAHNAATRSVWQANVAVGAGR